MKDFIKPILSVIACVLVLGFLAVDLGYALTHPIAAYAEEAAKAATKQADKPVAPPPVPTTPAVQQKAVEDSTDNYQKALVYVDNVIASIITIRTPEGPSGLTRSDVDNLRNATILLQTCIAELKELKKPKAEPETK